MASTYVNDLRLNEMATGDASGSWGTATNTNLELIGEAMGYGTEAVADASTHTITMADGATDGFRCTFLRLTGGGQACTVTLAPNTLSHTWIIRNTTGYALTLTQGTGANVIIAAGLAKMVTTDGLGSGAVVYECLEALELGGTLTVGVDDTGYDVQFFGATSGAHMLWDASVDDLKLVGAAGLTVAGSSTLNSLIVNQTITAGADDAGYDVQFFGATASAHLLWDASEDDLKLVGAAGLTVAGNSVLNTLDVNSTLDVGGVVTVGVDDTGHDVKFFGATSGAYMLWDQSTDDLVLAGAAGLVIPDAGTIGSTTSTDAIQISADGNVGINTTPPTTFEFYVYSNLDTDGTIYVFQDHPTSAQNALHVLNHGTANGIFGQVDLGTNAGVYGYHNGDTSNRGIGTRGFSVSGYGVHGQTGTNGASGYAGVIGYSQNSAHYGLLGHANTYGLYATSIVTPGVLSKGSGSFRIPHGLRENHDLIHSFIEGPQCDLIYRGRATLVDGRATISMDTKYGMTAGTFEWLTKADDVQTFTSNETGWDAVKSSFSGDTITIECQNTSSTDTISWMVVAERGDPNIIGSTLTDDDGNLIIERPSDPAMNIPPPAED
mgnify:CR=1 FL=1